jgi:hypothetical protein
LGFDDPPDVSKFIAFRVEGSNKRNGFHAIGFLVELKFQAKDPIDAGRFRSGERGISIPRDSHTAKLVRLRVELKLHANKGEVRLRGLKTQSTKVDLALVSAGFQSRAVYTRLTSCDHSAGLAFKRLK